MSTIVVLVMFEGKHRKLTLPEGSKLKSLIKEFMKKFEDVIPPNIVPADLFFQRYDRCYQEWVDLGVDETLCDGDKIRVQILSVPIFPGVVPHKVQDDTTYRIWSLASRSSASLMKRNDNTMKCNGSVATDEGRVLDITAKEVNVEGEKLFRLELSSLVPLKTYLITGKGENMAVSAEEVLASSPPDTSETKFKPKYFYAFTQFQCSEVNGETDLYLASDEHGKTTLAKGGQRNFPNPATLFICNVFA